MARLPFFKEKDMDGKNYIFGIDPSLSCVGFSVFDTNGNPVHICHIKTNENDTLGKRLRDIADFLIELRNKYPASIVAIEQSFSRYNKATSMIYRVHGIVNLIFWDLPQIYFAPTSVKATILSGRASKEEIQEKIKNVYKDVKFANNDESDSFSVGLTYFIKNGLIKWEK